MLGDFDDFAVRYLIEQTEDPGFGFRGGDFYGHVVIIKTSGSPSEANRATRRPPRRLRLPIGYARREITRAVRLRTANNTRPAPPRTRTAGVNGASGVTAEVALMVGPSVCDVTHVRTHSEH